MVLLGFGLVLASATILACIRWFARSQSKLPASSDGDLAVKDRISSLEHSSTGPTDFQDSTPENARSKDQEDSPSTTPKARPRTDLTDGVVPDLSLENIHTPEKEYGGLEIANGTTSAALKQSRPRPELPATANEIRKPASRSMPGLMPPPVVNSASLRPLPKVNGSVNPPLSQASFLRGQPPSRASLGERSSTSASSSTLAPAARPSRKVVLEPGYSPLDWAHLTRNPPTPTFLRGETVPPQLIRVTPSMLRHFNGRKGRDAWGTYQGKVYNLTPYLPFHPGGKGELMRGAGKVGEAERLFQEIHPWVNWDAMLRECLIGFLVSEGAS